MQAPPSREPRHRIVVELQPQPRRAGDGKHAILVEFPATGVDLVNIGRARLVLDEIRLGQGAGQLQVGSQADGGVPAVRDHTDAVLFGRPTYAPLFAYTAHLSHVGLHDVEGPGLYVWLEGLPAREDFAARDRHRRDTTQGRVIFQGVRIERLLEPRHAVVVKHARGSQRPLVSLPPEGVAAAGIHGEYASSLTASRAA